jgi:small subunit ribosomal protein S1
MEESKVLFDDSEEEKTTQGDSTENQESMEDLLEKEGLGLDFPKVGETRTGVIASISDTEILVSVGAKSEGIIGWREFEQIDPETRSELKIGQEIPVHIIRLEDRNGNLVLSFTRAREEMDWDFAEKLQETEDSYDGKVIGFNKGGLLVGMGQLRGFVPASQIGLSRRVAISGDNPEARYGGIVGESITVRVIEVDRARRRLILSERLALKETRESLKEQLLDGLNVGDVRIGRVTSLADFGAFVNIDGADGLVHMSEISWERIQSPREVLNVGQDVEVEVISIDRERKRIGLSIRRRQDNPWLKKIAHIQEGQLIQGTITHLTKFGAFAKLGDDDLEGLIHVSEISANRIEHPKEIITEGETLTLRVIKIDKERQRIGLSIRKVDSAAYADLDWKMYRDELDSVGEVEDVLDISEPEEALAEDAVEGEVDEEPAPEGLEAEASEEESPAEGDEEAEDVEEAEADEPVEGEAEADEGDATEVESSAEEVADEGEEESSEEEPPAESDDEAEDVEEAEAGEPVESEGEQPPAEEADVEDDPEPEKDDDPEEEVD